MKAITLQQPWAYAVMHLSKDVENRTWHWRQGIGTELAIHAGKTYDWDGDEFIHQFGIGVPTKLQTGAIVGLVTVAGVHHSMKCIRPALPHNTYCSPWAVGLQYHWKLVNPRPVTPVPCRGAQGVWNVPEDVVALVLAAGEAGAR